MRSKSSAMPAKFLAWLAPGICIFTLGAAAAHAQCRGNNILPGLTKSHPNIMAAVRKQAARIANTEAIFWRIEKRGLKPSYLFGTMHVSDERITNMPPAATKALRSASHLAIEIAGMTPTSMIAAVQKQPQLMVYTDGSRLDQKLSPKNYAKVSKFLGQSGLPKQMAAVMRPWMIGTMLAISSCEQQRSAKGEKALDMRIEAIANQRKIPVIGLETIGQQLQAMANVPDADQLAMLRVTLAYADRRDDMFETLLQSYEKRDLGIVLVLSDALAKIAKLPANGFANFKRNLIVKRNHRMFDASLPLVDRGNAFIAVGAAHLIDKTGLVALYKKAGFTVVPVN